MGRGEAHVSLWSSSHPYDGHVVPSSFWDGSPQMYLTHSLISLPCGSLGLCFSLVHRSCPSEWPVTHHPLGKGPSIWCQSCGYWILLKHWSQGLDRVTKACDVPTTQNSRRSLFVDSCMCRPWIYTTLGVNGFLNHAGQFQHVCMRIIRGAC